MDKETLDKMTLREVMEYSRYLAIDRGGLSIIIERIVEEIEELKKQNKLHRKALEDIKYIFDQGL